MRAALPPRMTWSISSCATRLAAGDRRAHQALDLALGEVAPLDCQVYGAWCACFGCRFHADKLCLRAADCLSYTPFLHSRKGTQASPRRQIGGPARGVAQPGWECLQIVSADVCEPPGGRAREN